MTGFVCDDGGRAAAGFKGEAGDCVTRAVAIATGMPYGEVYRLFSDANAGQTYRSRRDRDRQVVMGRTARNGIMPKITRRVLADLGWRWTPTMTIGAGTTVHLRADELPAGRLVARLSRHLCAVIDGVVHDTHDPSRDGTRAVYGYWTPPEGGAL